MAYTQHPKMSETILILVFHNFCSSMARSKYIFQISHLSMRDKHINDTSYKVLFSLSPYPCKLYQVFCLKSFFYYY